MQTFHTLLQVIGGIGLFLLGMIVMTDGLRALAGNAIRNALLKFTKTPISGAITGAISTAILQSSSATTVTAVGFVTAGLITFSQALGIILGANVGTTITGWLVVLLGFKLKLGTIVLPLILIGAILRLFSKGRLANFGFSLAGFGLIFVGITFMQQGMSELPNVITPESLPTNTLLGSLKLVLIGIIATLITQSSSAGVVATLTALFAGAINFHQAAALIIGMDVGTTVTALLASLAGSTASRRTGLSHVIYNLFTATGALLLITPYINLWQTISPGILETNAEIALVAFHSLFNILGVTIVLSISKQFSHLIEKLVPEKVPSYTRGLDNSLRKEPAAALTVIQSTIEKEFNALLSHVNALLSDNKYGTQINLSELQLALDETHFFVDKIHLNPSTGPEWNKLLAVIHALDHLQRLHERCEEEQDRAVNARQKKPLIRYCELIIQTNKTLIKAIKDKHWDGISNKAIETAESINQIIESQRNDIVNQVAAGSIDVPSATEALEAIRWLHRVSTHIYRVISHIEEAQLSQDKLKKVSEKHKHEV